MYNKLGYSLIKIAFADDHKMFRQSVCQLINSWENCKVIIESSNGNQLLKEIEIGDRPDLVISDLRMPEMNGFEMINEISVRYPKIKILVCTMFDSTETILQSIKCGAHGYIKKCSDLPQLKTAIFEIIQSGFYFSELETSRVLKNFVNSGEIPIKNEINEEEYIFLKLLATDLTYKEIADKMKATIRHIEYIRSNLFSRFEVKSKIGLVVYALEKGLIV
ncbi:MAG: response regulator transcription factor [Chitinophagaceae bacterium]